MNIVGIIVGLLLVAGGAWYYMGNSETKEVMEKEVMTEEVANTDTENETRLAGENPEEVKEDMVGEDAMKDGEGIMEEKMEEGEMVGEDAMTKEEVEGEKTFTVIGTDFAYDMKEIQVKKGDKVTINFKSAGGYHDWVLDNFEAATEKVQTDGETSVTFVAGTVGTFEYYCSVGQHRANGMVGNLVVTE